MDENKDEKRNDKKEKVPEENNASFLEMILKQMQEMQRQQQIQQEKFMMSVLDRIQPQQQERSLFRLH